MNESQFVDLYTYILKNKKTPIVSIDATHGEVFVPRDYIEENGIIQLCISPKAVRDLKILNDAVYCRASFKQQVFCISFPLTNIIEMSIKEG